MEPILIRKDADKIPPHRQRLEASIPYVQELHNRFIAIGLDLTLKELQDVNFTVRRNIVSHPHVLKDFVVERLVEKAGRPNFNGVPINTNKLAELIDTPDLTEIKNYVRSGIDHDELQWGLLAIKDGIVVATEDAEQKIDSYYTYYTQNEKGMEVASRLFDLCDHLNQWQEYIDLGRKWGAEVCDEFQGVQFTQGLFIPDLNFIRKMESTHPDYTAK